MRAGSCVVGMHPVTVPAVDPSFTGRTPRIMGGVTDRPITAYRTLASPSRVAILHALQQAGRPMVLAEVAKATGLHQSTARGHLARLVAAHFVAKLPEVRTTRGRPHMLYDAVEREALADADDWFRASLLSILLAGYGARLASRPVTAARAGEKLAASWVPRREASELPSDADPSLRQLAELEAHLDELRFAPEVEPDGSAVHLRHCPFLDLARANTDVVCSVHLGIARGVLARSGGPLTAVRLDPFVGPAHCILHLGLRDPAVPPRPASGR